MTKRPTLRDVAAEAGVATTTVTRVINKSGYVAEETRNRVYMALERTGYRVNALARSLKSDRSHVIGHLLKSMLPNPFYIEVARGVEEFAEKRGYTALTYNVQLNPAAERRGIDTFLGWRAAMLAADAISRGAVDIRSINIPGWVAYALLSAGLILCATEFLRLLILRGGAVEAQHGNGA